MSILRVLGLYFRTIRHIKISQLANYANKLIFKTKLRSINDCQITSCNKSNIKQSFPSKGKSILGDNEFVFLNKKLSLNFPKDWRNPDIPLLWLYNLHYFDGLLNHSTPSYLKVHLINCWIEDNSHNIGVSWDPYPLSLRICNWIKWIWSYDDSLPDQIDASLFQQATYLSDTLEFHLLGNHLLENAKALIFAGVYFGESTGEIWLRRGLDILKKELDEQILEDGGHFELSTMYHSLVLELVLDVLQLAEEASAPKILAQEAQSFRHTASIMIEWLSIMSHPDQEIAFFNDAAIGIAASPKDLLLRAKKLQVTNRVSLKDSMHHLKSSGYIRVKNNDITAIVDIAEVGASYIPGHAHADSLSMECSLFDQRLIVNSGSSEYGSGSRRDYERSTSAHSTLEIDGCNSSEVWGGFRVGRRARVSGLIIRDDNFISAEHNGYRFLPGSPKHRRSWSITEKKLLITDCINGPFNRAKIYYHIHPSIKVLSADNEQNGSFEFPNGSRAFWKSTAQMTSIQENLFSLEFGKKLPIKTIVLTIRKSYETEFSISWN